MTIAVAVVLLIFFLLSLKKPAWSYGIILGLLPAYVFRIKILNIPTTYLEILVGVFLLAVLLAHFNKESLDKLKSLKTLNWVIGLFLLAATIATIYSPEPMKALGQLKAFFIEPVLLFYAAVVAIKNKEQLFTTLRFLFWSAFIISLFGLVQYWTHVWLPLRFWGYGLEMKRITSVFEYPNALALYLAPVFIFFLATYLKGEKLVGKFWMPVGLILMAIALTLTYSRGAWLATIVAVVVLALQTSALNLKRWGIGGIILLLVMSPLLLTRMKTTFHDGSSSERVQLYKVAVSKITNSPLLGNGLYGFRQTLENSTYGGEILNYPHNIVLNFWVETGLLGVLSFFLIIFLALKQYRQRPKVIKLAAALFLLTIVTHGMVDVPYFKNDLSILFWFMLSVLYIDTD